MEDLHKTVAELHLIELHLIAHNLYFLPAQLHQKGRLLDHHTKRQALLRLIQ